jgi:N-acetylmuramoyl-L-alanine amidase
MPIHAGSYSVLSNNAPIAFWPLAPGTTVEAATTVRPPLVEPVKSVGVFDIVIQMSQDNVVTKTEAAPEPPLNSRTTVDGMTVTSMPLLWDNASNRRIHICFAVPIPEGGSPKPNQFEGTLRLKASYTKPSGQIAHCQLDVALRIGPRQRSDGLFIFYVVHRLSPQRYCWVKLRAVDATTTKGVADANVKALVLRDNFSNGFDTLNREVELTTTKDGYVAYEGRTTLAFLTDWPLIFRACVPSHAPAMAHMPRAHMLRFTKEHLKDNTQEAPFSPAAIPLQRINTTQLANRRFLLDPGHGVVYGFAAARRSQEWFGAHLVADRVAHLLQTRHGVPQGNLFWTRTAGFGLIEPGSVGVAAAPETGAQRYEFNLSQRRIRIRSGTPTLLALSNMVLTRHTGDANAQMPVEATARARLLEINTATVGTIVARLNQQLQSSHRRVQPGSVRWDTTANNYVYTRESTQALPNGTTPPAQVQTFPITTQDWFQVDDDMLEALADRSARWSLACEIGGNGTFQTSARTAMRTRGFVDYARTKILNYLREGSPADYFSHGTKAWGPTPRLSYINGLDPECDLYISIHLNAGGAAAKGQVLLVSRTDPPNDQIRLAKVFVKYVDPLGLGLRQGGIAEEEPNNPAAMLSAQNQRRDSYLYFELEFMDGSHSSGAQGQYRYGELIEEARINAIAEQIVAGIVEALLNRQPQLDAVTYRSTLGDPPLW